MQKYMKPEGHAELVATLLYAAVPCILNYVLLNTADKTPVSNFQAEFEDAESSCTG